MAALRFLALTLPSRRALQYRRLLVDWIFEAAEKFKQSNITAHVAVCALEIPVAPWSVMLVPF